MNKVKKDYWHYSDPVYQEAEIKANRFNFTFTGALIILDILIFILSLLGVFSAPLALVIPACIIAASLFISPLLVWLIFDKFVKYKYSLLQWKQCKYLIYVPVYFALLIVDIMLSQHAVLLIVIPPLMAAQYRFIRRDWWLIFITTVITIPIIIYGSFLFGLADYNLLKTVNVEEVNSISERFNLFTAKRALDLFLQHCLPRIFAIIAIDFLMATLVQRNVNMLRKQVELNKEVNEQVEKHARLQSAVIEELASVIETRDLGTGEHVRRTKLYVALICKRLAEEDKYKDLLTPETINKIVTAAPMHDIGKIAVSDTILLKPGKLTDEEFDKMKVHSVKGGEMVKNFFKTFDDHDFYEEAYAIATYHHEKWDGSGYPDGLKGEEIPLAARIMAIADVFDALVSKRVYKEPIPAEEAFDVIVGEAGHHFDPEMIKAIITIKDEFINASK